RDNLLETEAAVVANAGEFVVSDGPNSLTTRTLASTSSTTSGTTTSTGGFTSTLTGVGSPLSVTVETSTQALVYVGARMANNVSDGVCRICIAISGATTVAASDDRSAYSAAVSANNFMSCSTWELYTGLTPG